MIGNTCFGRRICCWKATFLRNQIHAGLIYRGLQVPADAPFPDKSGRRNLFDEFEGEISLLGEIEDEDTINSNFEFDDIIDDLDAAIESVSGENSVKYSSDVDNRGKYNDNEDKLKISMQSVKKNQLKSMGDDLIEESNADSSKVFKTNELIIKDSELLMTEKNQLSELDKIHYLLLERVTAEKDLLNIIDAIYYYTMLPEDEKDEAARKYLYSRIKSVLVSQNDPSFSREFYGKLRRMCIKLSLDSFSSSWKNAASINRVYQGYVRASENVLIRTSIPADFNKLLQSTNQKNYLDDSDLVKVYITNLPPSISLEEILHHFGNRGDILAVEIFKEQYPVRKQVDNLIRMVVKAHADKKPAPLPQESSDGYLVRMKDLLSETKKRALKKIPNVFSVSNIYAMLHFKKSDKVLDFLNDPSLRVFGINIKSYLCRIMPAPRTLYIGANGFDLDIRSIYVLESELYDILLQSTVELSGLIQADCFRSGCFAVMFETHEQAATVLPFLYGKVLQKGKLDVGYLSDEQVRKLTAIKLNPSNLDPIR